MLSVSKSHATSHRRTNVVLRDNLHVMFRRRFVVAEDNKLLILDVRGP